MDAMPTIESGWNLEEIYCGQDDPRWVADLQAFHDAALLFRHTYFCENSEPNPSLAHLSSMLKDYEQLQRRGLKACCYAQLLFAMDSSCDRHKAMHASAQEAWAEACEATLFFELDIAHLADDVFDLLVASDELGPYQHYLRHLRVQRPYLLDEKVEQVLRRKDLSGREGFVQLFDELTSSWMFSFHNPDKGTTENLTGEELLAFLYHPQEKVRESAFSIFLDRHRENSLVLTSCFNNILLDHRKEVELRGFPDLMTPTHLACETDSGMVEQMLCVSEKNYPLAQEYFLLKRRLLGLPQLKNSDIYAPLPGGAMTIPFTAAQKIVLEVFHAFAPAFGQCAEGFFSGGRIDALPRPGKSGGAFCHGMFPGTPPYLLLNYTGTPRDLSTLAHELGHGVHFSLSQRNNLFQYQSSLPLAETASVFAELLLTHHLLDHESDRQLQISLLSAKIEDIIATTFRQTVLTRFELAAHRLRGNRLLSSEDYCRLWWEENAKLFGDSVEMIEPYRWGWSYISHFIHSRFYCFSYVFGELLSLALYQRYREDGMRFVPLYLELLAKGGSESPEELLRPFDIDLHAAAFWEQGYVPLREMLSELRRLVDV